MPEIYDSFHDATFCFKCKKEVKHGHRFAYAERLDCQIGITPWIRKIYRDTICFDCVDAGDKDKAKALHKKLWKELEESYEKSMIACCLPIPY